MDEAAIEAKGIAPLADALTAIAAIADRRSARRVDRPRAFAPTSIRSTPPTSTPTALFGLWISPDLNDPSRYVPYLLQGGLGLPDREYYLDNRRAWRPSAGATAPTSPPCSSSPGLTMPPRRSARVFDLEARIAAVHWTLTESEDVLKANNPWTRDDFARRAPGLDWTAFFDAAGLKKRRSSSSGSRARLPESRRSPRTCR